MLQVSATLPYHTETEQRILQLAIRLDHHSDILRVPERHRQPQTTRKSLENMTPIFPRGELVVFGQSVGNRCLSSFGGQWLQLLLAVVRKKAKQRR